MTTATKPGAQAQGPSWGEVIADPSKTGIEHQTGQSGKKYSPDQPRDERGRFGEGGVGTGGAPGWAGDLVQQESDRVGKPLPTLDWRTGTSSMVAGQYSLADNRILVNATGDEQKDRFTLLHELAHYAVGSEEGPDAHGDQFVRAAYDLYGRNGMMDYAIGHDEFIGNALYRANFREEHGVSPFPEKSVKDFNEELHPRDDHGRFTDTGSLGDTAIQQGGFSLSLAGDRPTSGWMVSKLGSERSFSIEQLASGQDMSFVPGNPWHDNFTGEVGRFVSDHLDDLQAKGAYLGGWVDSGRLFLDVSYNFADEGEARQFAQDNQQFAMFNAGTGEYVSFDQQRRAASREADEQKAKEQAKENEKVLLKVGPDDDAESIAARLHRALFG